MFSNQSGERIPPCGALHQSACIRNNHREEAPQQDPTSRADPQQKIRIRLSRHLPLTLKNTEAMTPVILLRLQTREPGAFDASLRILGPGMLGIPAAQLSPELRV